MSAPPEMVREVPDEARAAARRAFALVMRERHPGIDWRPLERAGTQLAGTRRPTFAELLGEPILAAAPS